MTSGQQQQQLLGLAADIILNTKRITDKLQADGHQEPTFAPDSTKELWNDSSLEETKNKLVDAALTIIGLVKGPMTFLRDWFSSHWDHACLQVVLEHKVLDAIPLNGTI